MIAKYKVTGVIEIDLNFDEIEKFHHHKSETMKKAYLEELLHQKLASCSTTAEHELGDKIDFIELEVEKDWDKYCGNIVKTSEHDCGSPYAIFVENIPTTANEELDSSMKEIGERKIRHAKKWKE